MKKLFLLSLLILGTWLNGISQVEPMDQLVSVSERGTVYGNQAYLTEMDRILSLLKYGSGPYINGVPSELDPNNPLLAWDEGHGMCYKLVTEIIECPQVLPHSFPDASNILFTTKPYTIEEQNQDLILLYNTIKQYLLANNISLGSLNNVELMMDYTACLDCPNHGKIRKIKITYRHYFPCPDNSGN